MEVSIGVHGIELDRFLEVLERHVGAPQLEQDDAECVAIDRVRRVDVDRLLKGCERPRRLPVVEIAEGAIVRRPRLELLDLGLLLRFLRTRTAGQKTEDQRNQPEPVSS